MTSEAYACENSDMSTDVHAREHSNTRTEGTEKRDIRGLTEDELIELCERCGHRAFRGRQVAAWLWKHRVRSFEEMLNVPKSLRAELSSRFEIAPAAAQDVQQSADGSIKVAYRLHDGEIVEGVLIPAGERMTACISSQVGCSLRCAFCATARIPMRRNLSAGEIIDQVDDLNRRAVEIGERPLSNIVYMGMGEPLSNYDEVVRSMRLLTWENGFGISAKRITLSTAGLAPEMKRLADEGLNINLALSLHAATDPVRRNLMSSAREYPLEELADAVKYWQRVHGEKVTFEYLLLAGHNDSDEAARSLVRFASNLPCKINIIEYNPVVGIPFRPSDRSVTDRFAARLRDAGITVTVRHSSGKDIDAACGQLAGRSGNNR